MTADDPLIGRRLANYQIERVIGRGGMAVVYQATDIALRRPAAVKVIDARFRNRADYLKRFGQEARAVAALRHENILQVYYAGDQDGTAFFAMELIDGQNLADVLAQWSGRGEALPYGEVLRYGQALAAALDYAHSRGVIHRDVKPSNVLVAPDGRVVLGDFGLALDVQQGSLGEVFGTAHYTSPEQARRSSSAVPQSDLYSLGVMLYEMLTGTVPFDDPSPTSVALQHITLPPPPPRQLNPALSEAVEAVLLKALAKQPENRYQSGAILMAALTEALSEMAPGAGASLGGPGNATAEPSGEAGQHMTRSHLSGGPSTERKRLPSWVLFGLAGLGVVCLLSAAAAGLASALPGWFERAEVQLVIQTATPPAQAAPPTGLPAVTQTITSSPAATNMLLPTPAKTMAPTAEVLSPTAEAPAGPFPTPSWTPKFKNGRQMVLFWNESSFYMLQTTGYGELIEPLVFERVGADGQGMERFSGKLWAEFHAATLRDWCMRLEIGGPGDQHLNPPECQGQYLASRWPQPGDSTLFWTPLEGTMYFRVVWGREEVQRCEISAGRCEVFLP